MRGTARGGLWSVAVGRDLSAQVRDEADDRFVTAAECHRVERQQPGQDGARLAVLQIGAVVAKQVDRALGCLQSRVMFRTRARWRPRVA
ncbi:hypothetical protein JI76_38085 (plasmid) [Streptomyces anulatus]|nr:hypothetical protein JI76_38085 [Streptomyces anulatus]